MKKKRKEKGFNLNFGKEAILVLAEEFLKEEGYNVERIDDVIIIKEKRKGYVM